MACASFILPQAVTMSSLELVNTINALRADGRSELRHDNFMCKIEKHPGIDSPKFLGQYKDGIGRMLKCYYLPKRESQLMVMSESQLVQVKVYDRMKELEQSAKPAATLPDFSNPATAARAWAVEYELRTAASESLAIAAPKVAFVDQYVDATGLKGFREVAKLINANEVQFRDFLTNQKIMYRLGREWYAYQPHINAARFEVKAGMSEHNQHAFSRTLFTSKGVEWIAGLWAVRCLKDAL